MMTPVPIAHRGLWWPDPAAQNTPEALDAALAAGHGVEFDLRLDPDRKCLILAHDLPWGKEYAVLPAAEPWLRSLPPDGPPLLVNMKEPGTEARIAKLLLDCDLLRRAWLFDFELCGADHRVAQDVNAEVRCLERASDRQEPPWDGFCDGIWLDQWDSDWVTVGDLAMWKLRGPVFLVAPDLHGRAFDLGKLEQWREADGICTDIPHLLADVLRHDSVVHPVEPWWGD